ncbi:hypothetical protein [Aurantiacibacter sp. MUD61]|uniref:hypothetical protein n=1 Tax=Aurantiacibacter sp. MUD61 TaxID=3009083 RepID=UPI0022EFF490|nr:hypothetical protein [Aurantiacibacter sp. MUD61]
MRTLLALAGLALASPAFAQEANNPLDEFTPLLGNCYLASGGIDDGDDRHCWSESEDGTAVLQRHEITGGSLHGYVGEAIYSFNPETGEASYRYRNNRGGKSGGSFTGANGRLTFPDETYRLDENTSVTVDSRFIIAGPHYYSAQERQQIEGEWSEPSIIEFNRIDQD